MHVQGMERGEKLYLAKNMKVLRLRAGETQKSIANLLGVSEMTISRYESGENEPDLKSMVALSEHYNVTVDEMLKEDMQEQLPLYVKNIKALRSQYKVTQAGLAELLGFKSKSSYCLIEAGNTGISVENLIKLADYFGVTLDQLVKQDLSKESEPEKGER